MGQLHLTNATVKSNYSTKLPGCHWVKGVPIIGSILRWWPSPQFVGKHSGSTQGEKSGWPPSKMSTWDASGLNGSNGGAKKLASYASSNQVWRYQIGTSKLANISTSQIQNGTSNWFSIVRRFNSPTPQPLYSFFSLSIWGCRAHHCHERCGLDTENKLTVNAKLK